MSSLQAIRYERGRLEVLDQLQLPHVQHYDDVATSAAAFDCIRAMRVRGAPAIAIVASLALAVEVGGCTATTPADTVAFIDARLDYLLGSRPTAVDLGNAVAQLKKAVRAVPGAASTAEDAAAAAAVRAAYVAAAEAILQRDLQTNRAIGEHGADWLEGVAGVPAEVPGSEVPESSSSSSSSAVPESSSSSAVPESSSSSAVPESSSSSAVPESSSSSSSASPTPTTPPPLSLLTHCNTGSLATSGHGTALGIIRSLHARGRLRHAFCTETRPYNQGSRLTAYELVYEGIPSTLITDSMAAALFAQRRREANLQAVVVGADRVAANGDTANKIGTYALAVLARFHGVRFVVAAPTTSIDLGTASGDAIRIEERRPEELTQIAGPVVAADGAVDTSRVARVATADQRIAVWNPAFDVTPAALIDVIVTERGAVEKGADGRFDLKGLFAEE